MTCAGSPSSGTGPSASTRPRGRLDGGAGAELVAPLVGGFGAVAQPLPAQRVRAGARGVAEVVRDQVGHAFAQPGRESAGEAAGDAVVQHPGRGLDAVQVARRDGRPQYRLRVVTGQLRGAQQPLQRPERLVRGQLGALVAGQRAVGREPVERACEPSGVDLTDEVDHPVHLRHHRPGLLDRVLPLGQCGPVVLDVGEDVGQHRLRGALGDVERLPRLGVGASGRVTA